jgi:hypothetical protein
MPAHLPPLRQVPKGISRPAASASVAVLMPMQHSPGPPPTSTSTATATSVHCAGRARPPSTRRSGEETALSAHVGLQSVAMPSLWMLRGHARRGRRCCCGCCCSHSHSHSHSKQAIRLPTRPSISSNRRRLRSPSANALPSFRLARRHRFLFPEKGRR